MTTSKRCLLEGGRQRERADLSGGRVGGKDVAAFDCAGESSVCCPCDGLATAAGATASAKSRRACNVVEVSRRPRFEISVARDDDFRREDRGADQNGGRLPARTGVSASTAEGDRGGVARTYRDTL